MRHRSPVIDDVLAPDLPVVLCGMAAGNKAAREKTPYVGPANRFWPTLRSVGLIPPGFTPQNFHDLPRHGIGLTDVAKTQIGNDDKISVTSDDVARVVTKLRQYRPVAVGFVGKNAASHFFGCRTGGLVCGRQADLWEDMTIFVLPSTSARAQRFWDDRPWRDLAAFVRRLRPR